jgi:hypothetical protein
MPANSLNTIPFQIVASLHYVYNDRVLTFLLVGESTAACSTAQRGRGGTRLACRILAS